MLQRGDHLHLVHAIISAKDKAIPVLHSLEGHGEDELTLLYHYLGAAQGYAQIHTRREGLFS